MNPNELNSQWLDFYALLGVEPDADKDTLRRKIGETYAQASANCDHRDLTRRHYFQTLVERVLPQARRVLLDPTLRAAYDAQNALHRAGDENALDYVSFMAGSQGGATPAAARQAVSNSSDFAALPERVRDEINLARAVLEAIQTGEEYDFLPARAVSSTPSAGASTSSADDAANTSGARPRRRISRPQPPADTYFSTPADTNLRDTMPVEEAVAPIPKPQIPNPTRPEKPVEVPITETPRPVAPSVEAAQTVAAESLERPLVKAPPIQKSIEIPDETEPVIRAKVIEVGPEGSGKTIHELREAAARKALADDGELARPKIKGPQEFRSRVSIDDEPKPKVAKPQKRVLSPLVTHLATAVVASLLIFTILKSSEAPAVVAARVPLNVMYASELRPVLESAETKFENSPEGAGIDVILQPVDARGAMTQILGSGNNAPQVWIPSETVWSNRYNQVAAKFKRPTIKSAGQLALSPLVLVVRSEHAQALKTSFPDRKITSWNSLQALVARNCANHFGLTDPQKSGSGAIARYLMQREWMRRNPLRGNPLSDAKLWQWMAGFENNVPEPKSSEAMVKDLALSTTGQFWWALAYESDAIYWIGKGKPLEIFYLPATFYADHPYCHIEPRRNQSRHRQRAPALRALPAFDADTKRHAAKRFSCAGNRPQFQHRKQPVQIRFFQRARRVALRLSGQWSLRLQRHQRTHRRVEQALRGLKCPASTCSEEQRKNRSGKFRCGFLY